MNKNLLNNDVQQEILMRISKLNTSSIPLWGKMNVSQMLAHLSAQIKVALGEKKLESNLFGKVFGKMIKKKVLDEKPYSKGLPTASAYIIKHSPEFDVSKDEIISLIKKFNEANLTREPHSMFGKMTPDEWGISTWKHIDHHLNQFGA